MKGENIASIIGDPGQLWNAEKLSSLLNGKSGGIFGKAFSSGRMVNGFDLLPPHQS
jgi:hypothetical protein